MPAVRSSDSNISGGSTTLALTQPAGLADDDVLYAWLVWSGNNTITAPAGWTTLLQDAAGGGTSVSVGLFRKVITDAAGEAASYTFTFGGGSNACTGQIYAVVGADGTEEVGTEVTGGSGATDIVVPGVTVANNGSLVVVFAGSYAAGRQMPTEYPGYGRLQSGGNAIANVAAAVRDAGATGNITFAQYTGSSTNIGVAIAVNPSGSPDVAYVAVGEHTITAPGSTSHPVNVPDGLEDDDILVTVISIDNPATWTPPVGWTEVDQAATGDVGVGMFYHEVADAGAEPASYTFTSSSSQQSAAVMLAIRGSSGHDVSGAAATGTGTSTTATSITLTDTGLVVQGAGQDTEGGISDFEDDMLAGFATTNQGGNDTVVGYQFGRFAAGATGTKTINFTSSQEWVTMMGGFSEAAAPEPPTPDIGGAGAGAIRGARYGLTRIASR